MDTRLGWGMAADGVTQTVSTTTVHRDLRHSQGVIRSVSGNPHNPSFCASALFSKVNRVSSVAYFL